MKLLDYFNLKSFLYFGTSLADILDIACNKYTTICKDIINLIIDKYFTNRVDYQKLKDLYYYEPGGTSTKNILHWVQVYDSKIVAEFDYGEAENVIRYGSPTPPPIDLSKFNNYKVKSWITRSDGDAFSTIKDTTDFVNLVTDKSVLVVKDLIGYNHLDYVWSEDSVKDFYSNIFEFLKN